MSYKSSVSLCSLLMLVVFTFSACGFPALNTRGDDNSLLLRLQITDEQVGWASDFPAAADLAIILGTRGDAVVPAFDYENNGNRILPWQWLQSVSEAFYPTEVGEALDLENYYEEWRLVSIRVTPCGPIGITPDQDIDSLCWPAVRLVWQPVIEDMTLAWGVTTPSYADDRAIHAIYPLVPRDEDGHILSTHNRDEVMEHLQLGRSHYSIADSWREQFERERDTTALWLLNRVHDLRDPNLGVGSWNSIQVRAELEGSFESAADFTGKLRALLAEVAVNENLAEMTAFSLPEGRAPASADLWVFVGFDGNRGNPRLKDLTVIGRDSGQELINIGPSQSVGVGFEDPVVEQELEAGNWELADSLIVGVDEIATKGEAIADPYEFLVPNTSCASCHRLNNDLRFNFHALSGFETDDVFVSPRVTKDVMRELDWVLYGGR